VCVCVCEFAVAVNRYVSAAAAIPSVQLSAISSLKPITWHLPRRRRVTAVAWTSSVLFVIAAVNFCKFARSSCEQTGAMDVIRAATCIHVSHACLDQRRSLAYMTQQAQIPLGPSRHDALHVI